MTAKPNRPDPTDFSTVTEWVFDLDNTLYPRRADLFSQIDQKMTGFIRTLLDLDHDAARALQKQYYRDHGTTLQGLMVNHAIDANEFLAAVHDIDYSVLEPDPALGAAIKALPGRKFIFTNGDVPHARRTAEALGILDHFDDIFDIIAADLMPKPAPDTYRRFLEINGVHPEKAAMFEDLPRNLAAPHELGMRTVLVVPGNMDLVLGEAWEQEGGDAAHVHYVTDDLSDFLTAANTAA
jgi:putative hydrolase of the HAD superfamily